MNTPDRTSEDVRAAMSAAVNYLAALELLPPAQPAGSVLIEHSVDLMMRLDASRPRLEAAAAAIRGQPGSAASWRARREATAAAELCDAAALQARPGLKQDRGVQPSPFA